MLSPVEPKLVMQQTALTKSGLIRCSLCAEVASTVARSTFRRPTAAIGLVLSTVVPALTTPTSTALAFSPPSTAAATTDTPYVVSQNSVRGCREKHVYLLKIPVDQCRYEE